MIALDTECTGLDLYHGAKPFLVTICDESGTNHWWEWDVDPKTRKPLVSPRDLQDIQTVISAADYIILQNAKFDVRALQAIYGEGRLRWDWSKVYDTLIAAHLLASNQPHDLASLAITYLRRDIQPFEDRIKAACKQARQLAKKQRDWVIANKDVLGMPSMKGEGGWKHDLWLPKALAIRGLAPSASWHTLCSDYANADSATTLAVFNQQRKLLEQRGLWKIYLERLRVLPVAGKMERRGVTLSSGRLLESRRQYVQEAKQQEEICLRIAADYGYDLQLPKSGNNNSLRHFILGPLGLHSHKSSKQTGKPSLDREVLNEWEATLPRDGLGWQFVHALRAKRKRDTALNYLAGYERFWLPVGDRQQAKAGKASTVPGWYVLHPSLNPTGTDTLRWSSQNPNEQNISKQEGFNLRYCYGPVPGREWWSLDAANIELRIPAYEAGEQEMIDLFERPNDPPYYGSYHLLVFDTLHPRKFASYGVEVKQVYASTWYQWTKNGNFAVQYGAVEASGTADRAYHVPGAQRRIQRRFGKITSLNNRMIGYATKHGYVETMPDHTVDSKHGYPLRCAYTSYGAVLPTVPLNYHVQGTACWWMARAMVRCQAYLNELNGRSNGKHYHMIMQVHDELVFDFPRGRGTQPWKTNLLKIGKIRQLMEQGGDDIGVSTPVAIQYHASNWSEGVSI